MLQLYRCMRDDPFISTVSFGVYPRNHLPDCSRPGLYIVNVDPCYDPGSHWVLIYVDSKCDGFLFDSLGPNQPYTTTLESIVKGKAHQMVLTRVQTHVSAVCGGYALLFAREICIGKTPKDIPLRFSHSGRLSNDLFVQNYVKKHFGKHILLT